MDGGTNICNKICVHNMVKLDSVIVGGVDFDSVLVSLVIKPVILRYLMLIY